MTHDYRIYAEHPVIPGYFEQQSVGVPSQKQVGRSITRRYWRGEDPKDALANFLSDYADSCGIEWPNGQRFMLRHMSEAWMLRIEVPKQTYTIKEA